MRQRTADFRRQSSGAYAAWMGYTFELGGAQLSIVRVSSAIWASTEMGGEKGFNPAKQVKVAREFLVLMSSSATIDLTRLFLHPITACERFPHTR